MKSLKIFKSFRVCHFVYVCIEDLCVIFCEILNYGPLFRKNLGTSQYVLELTDGLIVLSNENNIYILRL